MVAFGNVKNLIFPDARWTYYVLLAKLKSYFWREFHCVKAKMPFLQKKKSGEFCDSHKRWFSGLVKMEPIITKIHLLKKLYPAQKKHNLLPASKTYGSDLASKPVAPELMLHQIRVDSPWPINPFFPWSCWVHQYHSPNFQNHDKIQHSSMSVVYVS